MTDDDLPLASGEAQSDQDPVFTPIEERKDFFLSDLVYWCMSGLEVGITLSVKGTIISGTLTSGKAYFEHMAEAMSGALADSELSAILRESVLSNKALYDNVNRQQGAFPGFIHLRAARIHAPGGGAMPTAGQWWRAKLASVDAFALGTYGVSES